MMQFHGCRDDINVPKVGRVMGMDAWHITVNEPSEAGHGCTIMHFMWLQGRHQHGHCYEGNGNGE